MSKPSAKWTDRISIDLQGMCVSLSDPVLVGRSRGYFWFPNLWLMSNGDLLSTISPVPDIHMLGIPYLVTWSRDDGLT